MVLQVTGGMEQLILLNAIGIVIFVNSIHKMICLEAQKECQKRNQIAQGFSLVHYLIYIN